MEKYCPKVVEGFYAEMLVELRVCPKCNKNMLPLCDKYIENHIFPRYYGIDFKHQLESAGWVVMSGVKVDDEYICKDCSDAGKADFECALCLQRKPSDKIQELFGDPPEYLCRDCYTSVPAKTWDDKADKLRDEHKWDFD